MDDFVDVYLIPFLWIVGKILLFVVPVALSMAFLMVMGGANSVSVVVRHTMIQIETPDEMRGRVSAANSLFVIASNQLGEFRAGLAAAWLGAVNAVMLGGACILLVVALGRKAFPELYAVETLEPPRR